jgi:AraC family transcriptional regulator
LTADPTQADYIERTNAAIDYIVRNLDGELKLQDVAQVACFSPFHFHRVFRSLLGETLNQFVKRQRLERALYLMSHAPGRSLTDIALACGFSSSSDFSRSFKSRYGTAPSELDVDQFRASKRTEFEAAIASYESGPNLTRLPVGENPDGFEVTLRHLPARTVAYIRVLDPYQSSSSAVVDACNRLVHWAEQRGLADGAWLGYMWEDPEIVALEDCRYDVAVVVDDRRFDFQPDGEIGRFQFPSMRVADVAIRGDIQLEQRAIDWLFGTWLPRSGFVPDDQPAFEAWNGRPFAHGLEHFEISCQLPVKRARRGRKL